MRERERERTREKRKGERGRKLVEPAPLPSLVSRDFVIRLSRSRRVLFLSRERRKRERKIERDIESTFSRLTPPRG